MKLQENLQRLCKEKKMSLAELARRSGLSQATVFGWANGRQVRNLDDLKKICNTLQISLHHLLYGEADPFEAIGEEILREIFKGDIRVTVEKIERIKK